MAQLPEPSSVGEDETPASPTTRRLTFLDLPVETQNQIISHCSQPELVCLSVVSRHFRDLAARQLYRNFHIVFPDEEDPAFESPIDSLAGGLDTFVTSEYDYSKHLREISLDTLIAGPKSEKAYKPYLLKNSCGKFMNTLLLLALRRSKCLETFKWNIRVELSRPVYKALHQIGSLKKLQIRMQSGRSLHEPLPPLPYTTQPPAGSSSSWEDGAEETAIWTQPNPSYVPSAIGLHHTQSFKLPARTKTSKIPPSTKEPPTFSGFKNLRSLSVLDIDDLEMISEIRACIKNSSSTLRKLRLSFSDALAAQARKPPPETESDESDAEDEFQVVPVPQTSSYDTNGPAKSFKAQEERKKQEAVLGRMFDIGLPHSKPLPLPPKPIKERSNEVADAREQQRPEHLYVNAIRSVAHTLTERLRGSSTLTETQRQEMFDIIVQASRMYVDSIGSQRRIITMGPPEQDEAGGEDGADANGEAEGMVEHQSTPAPDPHNELGINMENPDSDQGEDFASVADGEEVEEEVDAEEEEAEAFEEQDGEEVDGAEEDGVEAEYADEQEVEGEEAEVEDEAEIEAEADDADSACGSVEEMKDTPSSRSGSPSPTAATSTPTAQTFSPNIEQRSTAETLASPAATEFGSIQPSSPKMEDEDVLPTSDLEPTSKGKQPAEPPSGNNDRERPEKDGDAAMRDYVIESHGMAIQELAIHLVPIRASVLTRSLDLHVLEKVTLLNVGNQIPFWVHLRFQNEIKPLKLRRIFTDHVTLPFLLCVGQLEKVDELLMLERSAKYKPESFAPKVPVDIDQIRRLVLKKHVSTLKRLMIKDSSGQVGWDVNVKTILLICNRATKLEELAVSMGVHTVHAFMQHMTNLINLRALHIIHFRNSDTCIWVMRETLRFIVDSVAHNPQLKLEWIAIEDERVDRIMRPDEFDDDSDDEAAKKKKEKKEKKKALAATAAAASASGPFGDYPMLPTDGWDYSDSGSDDDEEDYESDSKLKLKTMTGVQFYDVWGVKLFSKEVRAGRI